MTYRRVVETLNTTVPGSTATAIETAVVTEGPEKSQNSAFLWEYSGNPGGSTVGTLALKARLSPDADFADVYEFGGSQIALDLSTTVTPSWNIMGSGIQIFYQQKWSTTLTTSTGSTRTVRGWHIE